MEKIFPKIVVKDIEKSWFWSRSRDFCQFLEGFGIGFGEFGLRIKSRFWFRKICFRKKKYHFRFWRIWSQKKVSVSENLVSKKRLGFGFGKFDLGKKVSVSENLVSEKSFGFEKFGLGKYSWFRFQKIWSRKKSRFRKIWSHKKSPGIGFGQNFGIVIQ